ncbi:hypothetical protein TTRE_0000246101 [Trichuris trichiura]|uniref:Uncharacterized protein n=1 Tax=Trichuris trichiura TaxID=36087 RepID=A0A077Z2E8_TRITR|nr:hypothetical protein TTRE_0000246101 [Trichuris trichiura]
MPSRCCVCSSFACSSAVKSSRLDVVIHLWTANPRLPFLQTPFDQWNCSTVSCSSSSSSSFLRLAAIHGYYVTPFWLVKSARRIIVAWPSRPSLALANCNTAMAADILVGFHCWQSECQQFLY